MKERQLRERFQQLYQDIAATIAADKRFVMVVMRSKKRPGLWLHDRQPGAGSGIAGVIADRQFPSRKNRDNTQ